MEPYDSHGDLANDADSASATSSTANCIDTELERFGTAVLTAGKHYAAIPLWELLMHHKGTNVVCWPDSDTLRRELPKRNTDGTLKRDANGMPILPSDRTLIRWRGYIQDAGLIQYKINARLGDLQPNVSPDTRVCVYYFDTAYSMMSKENQPNPANRWRVPGQTRGNPANPWRTNPANRWRIAP